MRPITYDELASLYDKHHGGRKARTLPMQHVINWATTRYDIFTVDDDGTIYVDEPSEETNMKYGTIGVMHGGRGPFTYRVSDEDDAKLRHRDIEAGDNVIVKNRYGYAVGEVFEVHPEPEDDDPHVSYAFAFDKIDEQEWDRVMIAWNDG